MILREKIVTTINKNARIIEFGPLNRPVVRKKDFKNVFYADVRTTNEIKLLYKNNNYLKSTGIQVDIDSIVDIDFVINDSYKNVFKNEEKFDVAILSHVIEHMPNIIDFFQDITSILKKDAKLIIIYPDKRYCFDHFRESTSFKDAYFVYKHQENNLKQIFDFVLNVIPENNPAFFWNNENLINKINTKSKESIIKEFNKIAKNQKTEDVHFWPFTDFSFLKFLYDLKKFELLSFRLIDFVPTQYNTQEFMCILEYNPIRKDDKLIKFLKEIEPNKLHLNYQQEILNLEKQQEQKIINIKKEYNDVIDSLNYKIEDLIKEINKLKMSKKDDV